MTFNFPKAVIFDWDNTLVDNWGSIAASLNAALIDAGKEPWSYEETRQRATRALRDSFPEWFGANWKHAHNVFYDRFNSIHLNHLDILPGAAELLAWLKERQVPLFVVSNKRGDALRKEAEAIGWTHYFGSIVGSMDAASDKPTRAPVDLVLQGSGLKADDRAIWFIGDTSIDMQCARNAGCTAVHVQNRDARMAVEADISVVDCFELKLLLHDCLISQP